MPSISRRRGVVFAAVALASTTTLAAVITASPAVATTKHTAAKTPAYYAGKAQGNVLGLNIDLPIALPALPNPLGLDLIHLQGQAVHDPLHLAGLTSAISTSTASLISGSLVDTLENTLHVALNRTAHVALGGQTHQESSLLSIPAKPLADLSVGDLVANLSKLTDATSSGARGVVVNIGTGDDLLGAATVAQVQQLLNSINVTGTLQKTVDQILTTLQNLTGTTPVVSTAVSTISDTVNTVLNKVNALVKNLGTTPLVKIAVHNTDQNVAPSGNGVKAVSTLGLVEVDVLGGLLSIDGFHSQAMAFANGTPGGARTSTSASKPLIKINAADALCAQLGANGISLCNVNNLGLPDSVTTQLNTLLAQLSSELNLITSKILGNVPLISETAGSAHAAADGKTASAVAPSYNISVGHLLTVTLGDGVSATAAALQKAPNKIVVLNNPENTPHSLPFTGVNLGELGIAGLVLLGVAAIVRRRLTS
jgi:hypothetical protein